VEASLVTALWDLKERLVKKSTSATPIPASMVDIAAKWSEGLGSPANVSRDIGVQDVTRKTGVTPIPACMMGCVWKSTMSWVTCAIVRQDTVARTVKIWIRVALIPVLTRVFVFILTRASFVTAQWASKANTAKNVIYASRIRASLVTNVTKQEQTAISASRTSAVPVPVCTADGVSRSMMETTYVRVHRGIPERIVMNMTFATQTPA